MAEITPLGGGRDWHQALAELNGRLDSRQLIFFPIRHHSPACAWHLARLIRQRRPATVLIEGPEPFNRFLKPLADPQNRAPFALYTQFVDRQRLTWDAADESQPFPPPRYGAFYPLCDYSPELVAVREASQLQARLVFCDLPYPQQVLAEAAGREGRAAQEYGVSLLDERHLMHNRYLKALASRSGCRDPNELWDRWFECDFRREDTAAFIEKVAAYCYFARLNTADGDLGRDGTLAREAHMWRVLQRERRRLRANRASRPLLVVTGGFHTPALALGDAARATGIPQANVRDEDVLEAMLPYSFQQLDALNGYAAGMPSPLYYQRLWEQSAESSPAALEALSRELLVELAQRTRQARLDQPLSTADAIAAHQQACNLARFRGNPGPMREDILDGVRSSFVKGSLDAEGALILDLALELLCGDAIGCVTNDPGLHPLREDFRRQAGQLGLQLSAAPRELSLEIYRKRRHLQISRLLHRLAFLQVPFAQLLAGPDFIRATGLDRQREQWRYAWTPQTESALVEASSYGATLQDAVLSRLLERQAALAAEGSDTGASAAVALLLSCCQLGLHRQAQAFIAEIDTKLNGESQFAECVHAMTRLDSLQRWRSPLEAETLTGLGALLETAYRRCCYLLKTLVATPQEQRPAVLAALPAMRETLLNGGDGEFCSGELDPELFWAGAAAVVEDPRLAPDIAGGLNGLLYIAGRLATSELLERIEASLLSADAQGNCIARFLHGLFGLCRELSWHEAVMRRVDGIVGRLDEDEFYRALPYLRLAFSHHTPQETDRVGRRVAGFYRQAELGGWYHRTVDEAELQQGSAIAARVRQSLENDGLLGFLGAAGNAP